MLRKSSLPVGALAATFLAFVVIGNVGRAAANDWRLVAKAGQTWRLPSMQPGGSPMQTTLTRFDYFSLNNVGQVAFASGGVGVWSEAQGDVAIARTSQQAPGLPPGATFSGQSFSNFPSSPLPDPPSSLFRLDDAGRTLFAGRTQWPYPSSLYDVVGYWAHENGQTTLIASEGTSADVGFSGAYYYRLGRNAYETVTSTYVTHSSTGGEFFSVMAEIGLVGGSSSGQSFGSSLWLMGPSGPQMITPVVRSGFGGTVAGHAVNRNGVVVYGTSFQELFIHSDDTSVKIADQYTQIPGGTPSTGFQDFRELEINDANSVAFYATISGGSSGLFCVESESLRSIVRHRDPVPDVPEQAPNIPGAEFRSLAGRPTFKLWGLSPSGEAVFQAAISGPAIPGGGLNTLWIDRAGGLERLVSGGDAMPGLPAGYRLDDRPYVDFTKVQINAQGTLVLHAPIINAEGAPSGSGIWALRTGADDFTPIIYTGEVVELPDGTSGTVSSLKFGEINDRGQILLQANIGGESLLVSNAVATLADFNADTLVDGEDLAAWTEGFGTSDAEHGAGDATGDRWVDGADFLRWQRELSRSATPEEASAVPEPGTIALATSALLAAMVVRRRRR